MKERFYHILPGALLTAVIGWIAYHLGEIYPVLGSAVIAIILGFLIRNFIGVPEKYVQGINYTLKKLLKLAIILLGFGYSFNSLLTTGLPSIVLVIIAVVLGFSLTFIFAKWMKLKGFIPILIGAGNAICGATAIATTGPILKAKQEEITYAINTIFVFNVLAVFLYPLIGQLLQLTDYQFGVWAGTAIHDTSSVVAAGYAFSDEAGDVSVVVKLIRTLMLVPVALFMALYVSYTSTRDQHMNTKAKIVKAFPVFILLFIVAALYNTFFPMNEDVLEMIQFIAKFLITMVMASVGLGTDVKRIKSAGVKPLLVGLITSIIMGGTTLMLILFFI